MAAIHIVPKKIKRQNLRYLCRGQSKFPRTRRTSSRELRSTPTSTANGNMIKEDLKCLIASCARDRNAAVWLLARSCERCGKSTTEIPWDYDRGKRNYNAIAVSEIGDASNRKTRGPEHINQGENSKRQQGHAQRRQCVQQFAVGGMSHIEG